MLFFHASELIAAAELVHSPEQIAAAGNSLKLVPIPVAGPVHPSEVIAAAELVHSPERIAAAGNSLELVPPPE